MERGKKLIKRQKRDVKLSAVITTLNVKNKHLSSSTISYCIQSVRQVKKVINKKEEDEQNIIIKQRKIILRNI